MNQAINKHVTCECKCKFDWITCKSNLKWNNDKCRSECKNPKEHVCKKDYALYPAICTWVNHKYSGSIIDSSLIICDKVIEETKTVPKKVPQQELFWKSTSTKSIPANSTSTDFYILSTLLFITIAVLITVSIYCYRIEFRSK